MYSAFFLLSCLAYVTASPVYIVSYAGGSGYLPCAEPQAFVDKATNKIRYRCPTAALHQPRALVQLGEAVGRSSNDCDDGEIYVPEVGICMEYVPPSKPEKPKDKNKNKDKNKDKNKNTVEVVEVVEMIEQNDEPIVIVLENTHLERPEEGAYERSSNDCSEGDVYVPEIDMCMPYIPADKPDKPKDKTKKPGKPNKPLQKDEPEPAVITVGREKGPKCKEGEIYLSELDICVCWPEENCED